MRLDPIEICASVCAIVALRAWHLGQLHWTVACLFASPLLLGLIPKLRIALFMDQKRTPAPKPTGKGPKDILKRSGTTLMALVIPPFRAKSSSFASRYRGQDSHEQIFSEPSSPRLPEPMSPTSIGLRVIERLHFNGNKYEFFARTKFAGCLREEECDELFKLVTWNSYSAGETIMTTGESIEAGLFMLVDGKLSVYSDEEGGNEIFKYSLTSGESVGDLDLVCDPSTKSRGMTVRVEQDSLVMQLKQASWKHFCSSNPHALLLYLRLAIGRLHRVATFVLADFIPLPDFKTILPDVTRGPDKSILEANIAQLGIVAVEFQAGSNIISVGNAPEDIVIIFSGEINPPAPGGGCCILGARAFFSTQLHSQDVCAVTSCRGARLSLNSLLDLGQTDPDAFISLISAAANILVPVIAKFITLGLSRHWIKAGEDVFIEGGDADGVYVVITGRVKLRLEETGEVLAEVGRGDTIGEEAVLDQVSKDATSIKRIFSARCMRDCELVKISPSNFEHICFNYPQVTLSFIKTIARRNAAWQGGVVQNTERRRRAAGQSKTSNLATIALIPINGESSKGTKELAGQLQHVLKTFGSALLLNQDTVRNLLGWETMDNLHSFFYRTRLSSWIAQQEEEYRFIVLLGDASGSTWSQVCVSQADVVLATSDHDFLPSILDEEERVIWGGNAGQAADGVSSSWNQDIRRELVLLHRPTATLPRMTKLWLDQRPGISLHHHVRLGVKADLSRLGRHLAGRAVGLVLGGGGARGLAHMGVLRAMEEVGIPIDFVGGTSQGAFMGCLYAQKMHTTRMEAEVKELSNGIGSVLALMRDLTLPILSIFSGKAFSSTIRKCLGAHDIRDCWINFFCVSCSVSSPYTSETVRVHRKGIAWKFVRASMSVVGYLPPVFDEGELLVDGGYVNNLPSDEMQKLGVHTIIAVDVEDKDESMYADIHPLQDHVSGWWILGIRILEMLGLSGGYVGGYGKVPRQSDMLTTLCYVASTNQLPKAKACSDLYLRPPVEGYALLDYHKKEEIVERAYKYALERLQKFSEQHDMLGLVEMHGPQRTATRSTVMPMLGADRETSLKLEAVKGSTTLLAMRSRSCSWEEEADSLPNMISPTKLLREGTATSMIHATALKRRSRRTRSRTYEDLSDVIDNTKCFGAMAASQSQSPSQTGRSQSGTGVMLMFPSPKSHRS